MMLLCKKITANLCIKSLLKKLMKSMSGLNLKTTCETSAVKSVFTISLTLYLSRHKIITRLPSDTCEPSKDTTFKF